MSALRPEKELGAVPTEQTVSGPNSQFRICREKNNLLNNAPKYYVLRTLPALLQMRLRVFSARYVTRHSSASSTSFQALFSILYTPVHVS